MRDSRQPQHPVGPSDQLVLSAVGRAVLHGPPHRAGAPLLAVLAHLAIPRRSVRARALRARLEKLERHGLLETARVHGVPTWCLSAAGARRLAAAARQGRAPRLPESPQHASWARARVAARQELERFASRLAADLAAAQAMLAALDSDEDPPHSDRWLALGRRLRGDCGRLGSAVHCLHEWPEPDDARADRDEEPAANGEAPSADVRALRSGRRNISLWADRD